MRGERGHQRVDKPFERKNLQPCSDSVIANVPGRIGDVSEASELKPFQSGFSGGWDQSPV